MDDLSAEDTNDQAQECELGQRIAGGPKVSGKQFSLRQLFVWLAVIALGAGYVRTVIRLREAEAELARLHREVGYIEPTREDQIAAVRLTSEEPMTYRIRIRVPGGAKHRVVYSSVWPAGASGPSWYGAVPVSEGESVVLVRVMEDSRDDRWKIATLHQGEAGTRRIATVLPPDQVEIFRGSHDWLASGIPQTTTIRPLGQTIRLLDERVLVGEGAMMLYGDRPPNDDMIGIFAELQPDKGPI
ncbi:hypothetical protein LOC67_25645 [Stieleria sp. JC731]|uniref:hypothetical protein n=1 Tax=Pirellulaceae TaxID=2691357 RepID=UPI001E39E22F|nr:hypothetical protein [Stieleria sp. JC731]MCC9603950.1 hypothetical protein [Stieleria sp. JC731]